MTKQSEWLWSALELALSIVPLVIGYRVALWAMAKPIADLPPHLQFAGLCPAFRHEHGLYLCEPLGTTQSQPWLLIAALASIVASWALALYIHFSGRSGKQSFFERMVALVRAKLA